MPNAPGMLFVVATPIGNMNDLSPRARETLAGVELIAAEDTRHSGQMLRRLGITSRMVSLHEHNESKRAADIVDALRSGKNVALISDAGTPLVSDPGYRVLLAVREAGLTASPVPGPCALAATLSVAGLPTDRFVFEGFLPSRDAACRERLEILRGETRTLVFYVAPHRIVRRLAAMRDILGESRPACVARELTKQFETVYYGTLVELYDRAQSGELPAKGEIVVAVHGAPGDEPAGDIELQRMLTEVMKELPPGRAASLVSRLSGRPRKEVYALTGTND